MPPYEPDFRIELVRPAHGARGGGADPPDAGLSAAARRLSQLISAPISGSFSYSASAVSQ